MGAGEGGDAWFLTFVDQFVSLDDGVMADELENYERRNDPVKNDLRAVISGDCV